MTAKVNDNTSYGYDDLAQGIYNITNSSPVGKFDASVQDIVEELKDRQGVRRMSYNIWHWDLRRKQEAEEYITYFYLKHE